MDVDEKQAGKQPQDVLHLFLGVPGVIPPEGEDRVGVATPLFEFQ